MKTKYNWSAMTWEFLGVLALCALLSDARADISREEAIAIEAQLTTQGPDPFDHKQFFSNALEAYGGLTPVGESAFGDSINMQDGGVVFTHNDVTLPTNGSLPVSFGRTLHWRRPLPAVPDAEIKFNILGGRWLPAVPHIRAQFRVPDGWAAGSSNRRCTVSSFRPLTRTVDFSPARPHLIRADVFWHGNLISIPGVGEEVMMPISASTPRPTDGRAYYAITKSGWAVSCLKDTINSDDAGEGFRVVTPDGTAYEFNWLASQETAPLAGVGGTPVYARLREYFMFATKATDRFGNTIEWTYDGDHPFRIVAIKSNDNARLDFEYNSFGRVSAVTDGDRRWIYTYSADGKELERVDLPGSPASAWAYAFQPASASSIDYARFGQNCDYQPRSASTQVEVPASHLSVFTVTHPSGARGEFVFRPIAHGYEHVPGRCSFIVSQPPTPGSFLEEGPPRGYVASTVVKKRISGVALQTQEWDYRYFPGFSLAAGLPGSGSVDCSSSGSFPASFSRTEVTNPAGDKFSVQTGNSFCTNLGQERQTTVSSGSQVLRTETREYAASSVTTAFPARFGVNENSYNVSPIPSENRPLRHRRTQVDGVDFTWEALQFNYWAVSTEVLRGSSLGYSKREKFSIRDYPAIWVLNQFINRQDVDPSTLALTTEEVHFRHSPTAQVARITHFLVGDYVRWYGLDGTLQSAVLPNGANVQLQDYFRGIPRRIVHSADNSLLSATVDAHGRIRSVTDALSNTTNYEYDALGRPTQTRFPTGDSTAWNNLDSSYEIRSVAEYGIPAGLWKRTQTRGRYELATWYDALWRPILTRERDVNLASSARFVRTAYDARGNLSFESYPGHLATTSTSYTTLTAGTTRQYDALNRPTVETRSSEHGNLVSRRDYLQGFQVRDTNARNHVTTTSFMAYDAPVYDWPVQILEPESKVTLIQRDRWGKPAAITREGWYLRPNGQWERNSATRHFVYDANQRLCKRIDPEHGAAVMDYDSANRLAWTADGLNLPSTTDCNRESVAANQRVARSYNSKDELTAIDYPDSTDDLNFTYYADGKPHTASVGPLGNRISRTYSYNKRRLPTQELVQIDGFSFPIGYRYSSEGAVSELGYPDNTWEVLNPDGMGRPRQMGQFASNVTWHRFGPLAGFTYGALGSGLSFSQQLNARGLPSERRDEWFGSARLHDTLSWDGNGNLAAVIDNVGSAEAFRNTSRWMTYDGLDRLTVADSSPQPPLRTPYGYSWGEARFTYDGVDNIRTFKMGAADFSYAYDGSGRLQSISQAWVPAPIFSYSHNARGQMTGRQFGGQQFTLSWDSAHRVTQTWNAGSSVVETYRYDAHGHRVRTVRGGETLYQIYTQSGDLLLESSSNGSIRKYARLGGRLIGETVNGARRTVQTDVIGSVRQKTDAFGTMLIEEEIVRAPYGSTLAGGQYKNGPAFTGHMEDGATGLTYMKARYYDPVAMRFISPDPVHVNLGSGGNFNRYWYANNNPYTYVDPDGRQSRENVGNVSTGVPLFDWLITPSDRRGSQKQMIEKQLAVELSQPRSARDIAQYIGIAMSAGTLGIARGPLAGTVARTTSLADDALVVRAGSGSGVGANTVEGLRRGTSTHPTAGVTGFSAESANGATLCELCSNMPKHYKQVGVTTAGEIRAAGGDVVSTPGQSPTHATVTGLSPETANSLLTPTIPNPLPKPIQ